ncbi:hypothetical protein ACFZCY_06245 [Streptomyces sp. NPDC007983]|uniref:hypothetical protein n=1 Tax=Streptomyces sp. NPDC007983 TaxID=3364800 RepID=UPI0036EF193E
MSAETTVIRADRAPAGKFVTWAKQHLNLTIKAVSRRLVTGCTCPPQPSVAAGRQWPIWLADVRHHPCLETVMAQIRQP